MLNLVQYGNTKLPKSTMIFNMSSSNNCQSKKLGLCSVVGFCYAKKAEKLYKQVLPYRNRQEKYWLETSAKQIIDDIDTMFSRKRKLPTHLRFNESGDFHSQKCIDKLNEISLYLLDNYNITTYGYTARKDLDFTDVDFLVKGSNNDAGNNGKTIVICSEHDKPEDFVICPGSCKNCDICTKDDKTNVAFIKH